MCVGHETRKGTIRWEAESLKREKVTVYTGGHGSNRNNWGGRRGLAKGIDSGTR